MRLIHKAIWMIVLYLLRRLLISPIVQVAVHLVTVRESGDYSLRIAKNKQFRVTAVFRIAARSFAPRIQCEEMAVGDLPIVVVMCPNTV